MNEHFSKAMRPTQALRSLLLALLILAGLARPAHAASPAPALLSSQVAAAYDRQTGNSVEVASGKQPPVAEFAPLQPAHAQPTLPAVGPRHGALPFVTVLCRFPDLPGEPQPPAFFERLLGDQYPGLDHYWRTVSYGAISLAGSIVVGWQTLPHSSAAYRTPPSTASAGDGTSTADLQRLAEDCTGAVDRPIDWPAYFGINLVFNANLDLPHGGQVCLALSGVAKCYAATWLWPSSLADQATWAHEIGHTLGLRHSSLDTGRVYDNVWDVMSQPGVCTKDRAYGKIAQDPLALDKDLLGWIPDGRKFVAAPASTATITMERLDVPGSGGYLLAEIPIPGSTALTPDLAPHFYTVEARQSAGYDRNLPGEAVVIHEVDFGREPPARPVTWQEDGAGDAAAMWAPGSIFRDAEHGIAVAVEQATPTGFVVTISTRPLPWPLAPRDHSLAPEGSVRFAWQPVPDATGYQIEITAAAGAAPAAPLSATVQSAGYSAVLAAGRYLWRVRALSAAGAQPWASPRTLIVGHLPAASGPAAQAPGVPPQAHGQTVTAVDGFGEVYALWTAPREDAQATAGQSPMMGMGAGNDVYFALRSAAGRWGAPVKISIDQDSFHNSLAIATDHAGNAYAIWSASGPGQATGIYFTYRPHGTTQGTAGGWEKTVLVNDDNGTAAHVFPALAVDSDGNAFATWIDGRAGHTGVFFADRPAGGAWSANRIISDDPQTAFLQPSMVADAQGNVFLAWQQDRTCRGSDIYFAGRSAGGTWGEVTRIAANPLGQALSRPSLAVDAGGAVSAAWQVARGPRFEPSTAMCGSNCGLPMSGAAAWGEPLWVSQDEGHAAG